MAACRMRVAVPHLFLRVLQPFELLKPRPVEPPLFSAAGLPAGPVIQLFLQVVKVFPPRFRLGDGLSLQGTISFNSRSSSRNSQAICLRKIRTKQNQNADEDVEKERLVQFALRPLGKKREIYILL